MICTFLMYVVGSILRGKLTVCEEVVIPYLLLFYLEYNQHIVIIIDRRVYPVITVLCVLRAHIEIQLIRLDH